MDLDYGVLKRSSPMTPFEAALRLSPGSQKTKICHLCSGKEKLRELEYGTSRSSDSPKIECCSNSPYKRLS